MAPGAGTLERNTRLAGRWLVLARVAWAIAALLILGVFLMALPVRMAELSQDPYQFRSILAQSGLGIEFFVLYATILDSLLALACLAIALVILWQKSDDWLGLLVSLALLSFIALLPVIPSLGNVHPSWQKALTAFRSLGLLVILLVFYQFPDGRFVPRWTRFLIGFWVILFIFLLIVPGFTPPAAPVDLKTWKNGAALVIMLVALSTGVFAQAYRYAHTANAVQRQQTKWVVFGFSAVFAGLALISLPAILFPVIRTPGTARFIYVMLDIPISLFSWFLLPMSLALSILKYRLWDIDIIIRRTLVYGVLTVTLAILYFGGVVLLQALFQLATRQDLSSIAIVVSTLAIVVLFTPLRQRIQAGIDRRFYRQKYDAEKMLKIFARAVQEEVELEKLADELLSVVEETLHPAHVSLWVYRATARPPNR